MSDVQIFEVGPRDGLQNEPGVIPTDRKVALIKALADAGLSEIEVGSFVSPKWVPQMADTEKVMSALPAGPRYTVLIPNVRGWENFLQARGSRPFGIAVFVSATEGFSRANLNCSIDESIARLAPVVAAAMELGVPVRGYISCVTDCPFEGAVAPDQVARVAEKLRGVVPMPLSLGDTIGKGTPETVLAMLRSVTNVVPANELAGHFHDTGGQALANVSASLEMGLRSFDASVGGLGGCPYAPGAPGNLATETLVELLHDRGFQTGVDPKKLQVAKSLTLQMRGGADGASQN